MTQSSDDDDDAGLPPRDLEESLRVRRQALVATRSRRTELDNDTGAVGRAGVHRYEVTAAEVEAYVADCVALVRECSIQQSASIDCRFLQVEGNLRFFRQFPDIGHFITVTFDDSVMRDLQIEMIENKRRNWSFSMDRTLANVVFVLNADIRCLRGRSSVFSSYRVLNSKVEFVSLTQTKLVGSLSIDGHSEVSNLDLTDAVLCGGVSLRLSLVRRASLNHARIDREFFLESVFFFHPPELQGASLPPDVSFESTWIALFEEDSIRKSKMDSQGYLDRWDQQLIPRLETSRTPHPRREVVAAARALRLAMKRIGAQWEEARFFAVEQRAERKDPTTHLTRADRVTSYLYDAVSRYGTSSQRALVAFVAWNTTFGVLVWASLAISPALRALDVPSGFDTTLGLPADALTANAALFQGIESIGLALQSAFNPLALLGASPAIKVNSLWLALLSMLQSLGSLGIAALALLAIRNRFHRGGGSGT